MEENNKQQVQVLGKEYKVDVPATIYPEYFAFMDEADTSQEDMVDFLLALREYTKGNFDYTSPNKYIRAELRQVRMQMKLRHDKYIAKYIQQKEAASRGGKAKKQTDVPPMGEEAQAHADTRQTQSADNESNHEASAKQALSERKANKEKEKEKDKNKNNPPTPVLAGMASGGDGFKFLGFLGEYERLTQMASSWQLPAGSIPEQRDRAAWMCSNPRMQPAVIQAIEHGSAQQLQDVCASANNAGMARELWKLCQQVDAVTAEQLASVGGCNGVEGFKQAVAHEINSKRMAEGTAVFKVIADKIRTITSGTPITSLQGFLASRGKR